MSIKTKPSIEMLDEMHKQPKYWKAGIFYVNSNDSRLFVPKRAPYFGWTLNFGNPFAYVFLIVLIVIIGILPLILTK
ncbi:MAG TPA: hypothetical protein DIW31_10765 [Bacteroidales bacterium]|nr:hypothetical protein [Bacteroidales bacterium]